MSVSRPERTSSFWQPCISRSQDRFRPARRQGRGRCRVSKQARGPRLPHAHAERPPSPCRRSRLRPEDVLAHRASSGATTLRAAVRTSGAPRSHQVAGLPIRPPLASPRGTRSQHRRCSRCGAADRVAGSAGVEILDMADELLPHGLHGFRAGPRHMRRHDHIGAIENPEQRVPRLRRFAGETVEIRCPRPGRGRVLRRDLPRQRDLHVRN